MSDVDNIENNGSNQTDDLLIRDVALTDWIYHRDKNDQGLSVGEIADGLNIVNFQNEKPRFTSLNLTIADDNFIYNVSTGLVAAVVNDDNGNVTIVVRGTDVGDAELSQIIGGLTNTTFGRVQDGNGVDREDVYDLQADATLGTGSFAAQNQLADLFNVVRLVKEKYPASNIVLAGQSLGGGLAGAAAAVLGLPAVLVAPAPFARQIEAEAMKAALRSALPAGTDAQIPDGLVLDRFRSYDTGRLTVGDYIDDRFCLDVYGRGSRQDQASRSPSRM